MTLVHSFTSLRHHLRSHPRFNVSKYEYIILIHQTGWVMIPPMFTLQGLFLHFISTHYTSTPKKNLLLPLRIFLSLIVSRSDKMPFPFGRFPLKSYGPKPNRQLWRWKVKIPFVDKRESEVRPNARPFPFF